MSRKKPDLSINIAGVTFKNPVMTASGTFGSGEEFSQLIDISRLGAVVTKGVSITPWTGNDTPRVCEVTGGMLNAIGLQNPGVDLFIERDVKRLDEQGIPYIVNVCGKTEEEYLEAVDRLNETSAKAFEINISCPNVKAGGIAFGQDSKLAAKITGEVKKHSKKPVIMKLSPNVTDITQMAKAVEDAGADAVSLINTLTGMKIDIEHQRFALANKTGGLSGPCIKPVAVRMVYQTARAVKIPIIGMGGISCYEDAVEFLLAGATAVSVGTANFSDPNTTIKIIDGIEQYLLRHGLNSVSELKNIIP